MHFRENGNPEVSKSPELLGSRLRWNDGKELTMLRQTIFELMALRYN